MQLTAVDPVDADALARWYGALRAGATHERPTATVPSFHDLRLTLRDRGPRRERHAIVAAEDGRTLGAALLDFHLVENRQVAEIEVDVPPGRRGRGVGSALLVECITRAKASGRTTYIGEVNIPDAYSVETWPGSRFARAHGFRSAHREDHLLLEVADARVLDRPPAHGYRLRSWAGPCPDDLVDDFAVLRTAMGHDVPIGELAYEPETWTAEGVRAEGERLERRGMTGLTTMVTATSGHSVGYSRIFVRDVDPADALQDDTFVLAGHRGHGLGLMMKARNLHILRDDFAYVRRVHTYTAGINDAMQSINRAFGFVRVETMHEFQRIEG